ncbi:MAG: M20/M25/M40 family metallo-hydrolase [Allosphingosinicella sp.]|uniref:M20/M25/M40 family metallo-hydrolase n=1 Tax=Allosphingosinicella sp. TaxID=2823234 RepID=UPI0039466AA4
MKRLGLAIIAAALLAVPAAAQERPDQREARAIFERLVSFRTAQGHGQVPAMAAYIADRLRAAGVPDADIALLPHGETVAMLVRLPGTDPAARPVLFSGHMDVVDARPEDWERDPFTLIEEDGYFFGRGTGDNKTGITALTTTILRMKAAGHRPRRTLVFAFVGDEETGMETTRMIAAHEWVRGAEYAINTDAGGGGLTPDGQPFLYAVQGAEKTYATYRLTARNPGGHSSRPRDDNAIYALARALLRIEAHRFPAMSNPVTVGYFRALGQVVPGEKGAVYRRFAADPSDADAIAALRRDPADHGVIATTCVATMAEAGHAENALPQRAEAMVNCRIFPGVPIAEVADTLRAVIADPEIAVEVTGNPVESPISEPRADVMAAVARSIHRTYPGLPITPYQESGGTDGLVYRNAGIPTFASSGKFFKDSDIFFHGLNERVPVASFYHALDHIHDLAIDLGGR